MITCWECRRTQTVCHDCRSRARRDLAALPDLHRRLVVAAAGPATGIAEYVSGRAFGARPPLVTAALSLTATTAAALALVITYPAPPERGDSIPLWLTSWATLWRSRWDHHTPAGVRVQTWNPGARLTRDRDAQTGARVILGLGPAAGGPGNADPLAEHWATRFGDPDHARRFEVDHEYLTTWLDRALDDFDDARSFTDSLTALADVGRKVAGDGPGRTVLGRCPEPVWDVRTGRQRVVDTVDEETGAVGVRPLWCGAWITRDEDGTITCSRCGQQTRAHGTELLRLAARMRDVWRESADRDAWAA